MATSLFSSSWYRVAEIRPRLRGHAQAFRQVFRGQVWYVLQDRQSGHFHRLSPMANLMLCLMDGRRTVQDIWDMAGLRFPESPPTQDETIELLAYLHSSDLLQTELPPDFDEMAERAERASRRRLAQQLRNPMALRIPLFDPDRWLTATLPLVRPLFTVFGLILWLALVIAAAVVAGLHWGELNGDIIDRVLVAENVLLMLAVYPVVKSLHELGHAYATKTWGGEVHEVGIMLLVFIPVLYVDASSSAAFADKRRRIVVGAAGILVEVALAAIAMIVWANASPGIGRSIAFDVMLIGGVSTVLFNGNPLLRFDGYYILSDWLEIPNLASRANSYVQYVFQKWVLWIDDLPVPVVARGEGKWLLTYAVSSWAYRFAISFGIAAFLATKFFIFGLMLALWSMATVIVLPIVKGVRYLVSSPRLRGQQRRVTVIVSLLGLIVAVGLFAIPIPYSTHATGVVVYPDHTEVRARTAGFLKEIGPAPDSTVKAGQTLVRFEDPTLEAEVAVLSAQLDEAQARLSAVRDIDRVQAKMFASQVDHLKERLANQKERKSNLVLTAERAGRFVISRAESLPGRYFRRGDLIGYVVGDDESTIQMLVPQTDIDLIRERGARVEVRPADAPDKSIGGEIRREVPAAQQDIPNIGLTTRGGGDIALDPSRTQKPEALFSYFLVEVKPQESAPFSRLGIHASVRFSLPSEPVAYRILRSVQQFFIGQFRV